MTTQREARPEGTGRAEGNNSHDEFTAQDRQGTSAYELALSCDLAGTSFWCPRCQPVGGRLTHDRAAVLLTGGRLASEAFGWRCLRCGADSEGSRRR